MDKKTDAFIIQLLTEEKVLEEEQLNRCFRQAEEKQCSPIPLVARLSNFTEARVLEIIAKKLNIEYIDLKIEQPAEVLFGKIPVKIASYYKFVPVRLENRTLTIATAYPLNLKIHDEIRTHLGYDVKYALSCEGYILEVLNKYYGLGAGTLEKMIAQKTYEPTQTQAREEALEDIETTSEKASVIQLVNQIILEAYKRRATDIHVEPYRNKMRLRYRIDGILYDANISPEIKNFIIPILSRIKLMSNLNIVERRVPQDGRAIVKVQDQMLDLRVSFIPTPHGESVVIRILPTVMLFGLDKLGLNEKELKFFEGLIKKPHGIIFVTGPTGSGKTTTLYACLSTINTSERKIVTIEDPIEYELEGITQIQVAPELGLDFARGLRSMLRHDPDVMMVGEVRDLETAEIAIRVALTGHLVFSTLHTNDAASGVTRLIDIGLEPYLVASSVDVFIAQRLIRVICPHCKEEDANVLPAIKKQISEELGYPSSDEIKVYRGKGCQMCNSTGFFGRTAIHEMLVMDEAIKDMTIKKASSDQIKKVAVSKGMRTLRQNGWIKVLEGITTYDEVIRVTHADAPVKLSAKIEAKEAEPEPKVISLHKKKPPQEETSAEIKVIKPSDRRVYERLEDNFYVRFRIFQARKKSEQGTEYEPELIGITRNVSAGGILFSASERLEHGKIIELKLELPDNEKEVECLGRVIRCEEVIANKDYHVAACFLDLPSSERSRINRYILRFNKEG